MFFSLSLKEIYPRAAGTSSQSDPANGHITSLRKLEALSKIYGQTFFLYLLNSLDQGFSTILGPLEIKTLSAPLYS